MTELSLLETILREFGPLAALIVYYIWRDFLTAKQNVLREVRLTDRVTQLEDFQRGELTKALVHVTSTMRDFSDAAKTRPCLLTRRDEE